MDNLYEDLHWLLLISGYLLADESNGETPLIPKEIISYSTSLKSQVDIQATFQTLCASQNQNQGKCYVFSTHLSNLKVKNFRNTVRLPSQSKSTTVENCKKYLILMKQDIV